MSEYTKNEARVAIDIINFGLGMRPDDLTGKEKRECLDAACTLIEDGHDVQDLRDAARHGMSSLWPFSEGEPWGPSEMIKNITRAKAYVSKLKRQGRFPRCAGSA